MHIKGTKGEVSYNTYYLDSKFINYDCNYKPPTNTGGFIIKLF
jgi:hypothetical protein